MALSPLVEPDGRPPEGQVQPCVAACGHIAVVVRLFRHNYDVFTMERSLYPHVMLPPPAPSGNAIVHVL